jgi:putative membrane protein
MKQPPVLTRQFLFTGIYLVWWITLISFVLSGAYRSFIRPSFVIFLWGALVILLVFIVSEILEMGSHRLRLEDIARGSIFLLPLMALWMAYGKPLGSYAYRKKTITAQHSVVRSTFEGGNKNVAGIKPSLQPELRRDNEPPPLHVTILDLIKRPQNYQGKWITTVGMALRQESYNQDVDFKPEAQLPVSSFTLFRFLIVCCVADSQPLGVIVEYAKAASIMDNDWYRVTGRFSLNKDKEGIISHAVVSSLETPPDPPYLFDNMKLQAK